MESSDALNYYLQVVKKGEKPTWPRPEEELVVGSQNLSDSFIQYWAYPKDSGRSAQDLPEAEILARQLSAPKPTVLIDQPGSPDIQAEGFLELVAVKDNHAWAKTESNLDNLADNLSSVLDFVRDYFGIEIAHFMTTERVSSEVEQKLDQLEKEELGTEGPEESEEKQIEIKHLGSESEQNSTGNTTLKHQKGRKTLLWTLLPALLLGILFLGVLSTTGKLNTSSVGGILSKFLSKEEPAPTPTQIPSPTLTPTPTLDRSKFKVRVLNGTNQTGVAASLADDLKTRGWVILSVGNAPNFANPQTYIRAKNDLDQAVSAMISDLSDQYQASSSSVLSSSDKADIEVVIGKK